MDSVALEGLQAILNGIWTLGTSWKLPIFNATPVQLGFFFLVTGLTVKFLKSILTVTSWGRNND